jgi:hypothetical protein
VGCEGCDEMRGGGVGAEFVGGGGGCDEDLYLQGGRKGERLEG